MKVNIFKKLIREVVREELDYKFSSLEKKLDEVLVKSSSNSIVEDRLPQPVSSQPKKQPVSAAPPQSKAAPLTKDSILNDILNETAHSGEWQNIEKNKDLQNKICHKVAPSKDLTINPPKLKLKAPKKISNGPGKLLIIFILFVKLNFEFPFHTS